MAFLCITKALYALTAAQYSKNKRYKSAFYESVQKLISMCKGNETDKLEN